MTFADGTTAEEALGHAPAKGNHSKKGRKVVYRTERAKREALRLAAEIGVGKAAAKLGIPISSLSRWKSSGMKPLRKAPVRGARTNLQRLRGSLSLEDLRKAPSAAPRKHEGSLDAEGEAALWRGLPPGRYVIAPKTTIDTPAGPIDVACEGRATAARVLVQLVLDDLDPACTSAKLLQAAVKVLAP